MIPGDTLFSWPRRGRESDVSSSERHCRQCGFEGVPRIPRGTFSSFMCCRTTIVLQAICAEVTEFLVFTRRVLTVSTLDAGAAGLRAPADPAGQPR